MKWKILNKEFGPTYPCNRLLHRWFREGGEGGYGWLCGCSHGRFLFCTTCTAVLVMDDGDGAVRTYDCFMPHCRCVGDGGLTMVLHLTVDVWVMEDLQWFYASL